MSNGKSNGGVGLNRLCGLLVLVAGLVNLTARSIDADEGTRAEFWLSPGGKPNVGDRWFAPAISQERGRVRTLTDRRFEYVAGLGGVGLPPGEPVVVAADRVIWVRPLEIGESEKQGIASIVEGGFDASLRKFIEAIDPPESDPPTQRPAVWHQQWLSMAAAQSAARAGRGAIALELVRQLDRRPLPPMVLGWLPLVWQNSGLGSTGGTKISEADAKFGLADPSPLVRLVAASSLVSRDRTAATATLTALSRATDRPSVSQLAQFQLVRVATPVQIREQHEQILSRIETLPMALQTGPLVMLAGKLESAGLAEPAKRLQLSLELTPIIPHPDVPSSLAVLREN